MLPSDYSLPPKFTSYRPSQLVALDRISESDKKYILLQAPTGSGKSLVASTLQKMLSTRVLYVCKTIQLQQQFKSDFPYAELLMGRANYPVYMQPEKFPRINASMCTRNKRQVHCVWCCTKDETPEDEGRCTAYKECPYYMAKLRVLKADLAITNMSITGDAIIPVKIGSKITFMALDKLVETKPKGAKVFAFNRETLKCQAVPIEHYFEHGEQEVFNVALKSGRSVKATAGHNFWRREQGKINAVSLSNLKPGDEIAQAFVLPQWNRATNTVDLLDLFANDQDIYIRDPRLPDLVQQHRKAFEQAKQELGLKTNNYFSPSTLKHGLPLKLIQLAMGHTYRELNCSVAVGQSCTTPLPRFFKINDDFLWLLGLWVAEGWHTPNATVAVSNTDETIIKRVQEIVGKLGVNTYHNGSGLDLLSSTLKRLFEKLEPGVYATGKRVPEIIFQCSIPQQREFLLGYLAGDGHKGGEHSKQDYTGCSTVSKELAKGLGQLFLLQGWPYREFVLERGAHFGKPQWHDQLHFSLYSRNRRWARKLRNATGDIQWEEIASIERAGRQPVFDLQTKHHNFIANGIYVHNSLFLNEANYVGGLSGFPWMVIDEGDLTEESLMSFSEFRVTQRWISRLKLPPPDKKTREGSWIEWAKNTARPKLEERLKELQAAWGIETMKEEEELEHAIAKLDFFLKDIETNPWVYTQEPSAYVFKPVFVSKLAQDYVWRHASRFLVMSATIISAQQFCRDLGIPREECEFIDLKSEFDPRRRPVYYLPAVQMTHKTRDTAWPQMVKALDKRLSVYQGKKVLVHTVSTDLAQFVYRYSKHQPRMIVYGNGVRREDALKTFIDSKQGKVLVAQSMERGVDLPDALCRIILILKVPYLNLGDKQIAKRVYGSKDGNRWYHVQAWRTLIQGTGRGMRHERDWCLVEILDAEFGEFYRKTKSMVPAWWKESLRGVK